MITTGLTTRAKMKMLELLAERPVKVALYDATASIGPETAKYTTQGESVGRGYKAGGLSLRNARVWEDRGSACLTWDSPTIPVATVSANGFAIYDAETKDMYFVGAFNQTCTSTEGPWTVAIASDVISIS